MKRIFITIVAVALMLAMSITPFAAEVGDTFTCELAIGTPVSGQFYIAGYEYADGSLAAVEATERATWSPEWPGHFIADDTEHYVASRPEQSGYAFDLMPKVTYGAAVVFKAPVSGTYTVNASVTRLYEKAESPVDIALMKADGTVLAKTEDVDGYREEVTFENVSVTLAENELVFICVTFAADDPEGKAAMQSAGGYNVGFSSFEVTLASIQSVEPSVGGDGTGSGTTNTNPDTSDNVVLAVSALALAAAGVVIAYKKRR